MSKITTIGLDLAKHVFHVVCCDEQGELIRKEHTEAIPSIGLFCQSAPVSGRNGGMRQRPPLGTRAGRLGTSGEVDPATVCETLRAG